MSAREPLPPLVAAVTILRGDCRDVLAGLPSGSVHCCITSPPYWGLRDYGVAGQLGLEPTPAEYVERMVAVFREVRRVLRDDGTLWLNLGDSYATGAGGVGECPGGGKQGESWKLRGKMTPPNRLRLPGLKPKDLVGIPWRVAFALQADGWWLRSDIIWHKPNPMPESVTDRPTKAHEYLFLLAKSERYYYDAAAIAERTSGNAHSRGEAGAPFDYTEAPQAERLALGKYRSGNKQRVYGGGAGQRPDDHLASGVPWTDQGTRNRRTVWTVPTQPYSEAHFATFPPKLIEPCVLAGCPEGGMILDPFGGAGTVGLVALQHRRSATLIELNPAYCELIRKRCTAVQQQLPLETP